MVSRPDDAHDPRQEMERVDNIVLSALGEQVDPEFAAHLATCPTCQAELDALTHTADLAREGHSPQPQRLSPSPSVWDSIAAELGLERSGTDAVSRPGGTVAATTSAEHSTGGSAGQRRGLTARGWPLAAAAAVLAVVAGGVGYLLGHDSDNGTPPVAAVAALAAMPGGPAEVHGTAKLLDSDEGTQLSVSTVGLPVRSGYYEVWLYNPELKQMVAVGTLATDHAGTFPVPAGLDPADYSVVDVSAQKFDGNPEHQQSVLRGELSS